MESLKEVKEAFNIWRQNKARDPNVSHQIPGALWTMARGLLETHPPTLICKTLGLNHHQFKKRCCSIETTDVSETSDAFLEARVPIIVQTERCELSLEGKNRTLRLKISEQQLPFVCSLLQAYL